MNFPDNFLWGAATSAYQIEGSPLADGAGPNIWHEFCHTPGRVYGGHTGDSACDHYNRYKEDIELMKELGLTSYRFSIAWSRIFPEGIGKINAKGLDFYNRLVDALLEAGITPLATLYHWDLPLALENRGGWPSERSPEWFARYARVVFNALGDRVPFWATINEPWVVVDGGYRTGLHAPGHSSLKLSVRASRHLLLAHAYAVEEYRRGKFPGQVGLVVNLTPKHPYSESEEDQHAARLDDAYLNRQFLDPVFFGKYPEEMLEIFGEAWKDPSPQDLRAMCAPIDFVGINYYFRDFVQYDPSAWLTAGRVRLEESLYTEMGWEVYPQGLTEILCWVRDRYGDIPLYVTENGAAFADPDTIDADVLEDPLRVQYFREHLLAVHAAIEKGVRVKGYFAWSLLDNFEWSWGYSKRFGIVHVDFETQKRTLKRSALLYRDMIRTHGATLLK